MLDYSLTKLFIIDDCEEKIKNKVYQWIKNHKGSIDYVVIQQLVNIIHLPSYTVKERGSITYFIFEIKLKKWKKDLFRNILKSGTYPGIAFKIIEPD